MLTKSLFTFALSQSNLSHTHHSHRSISISHHHRAFVCFNITSPPPSFVQSPLHPLRFSKTVSNVTHKVEALRYDLSRYYVVCKHSGTEIESFCSALCPYGLDCKALQYKMEYLLLHYLIFLYCSAHFDQNFVNDDGTRHIARIATLRELQKSNPNVTYFNHASQPKILRIPGVPENVCDKGASVISWCDEHVSRENLYLCGAWDHLFIRWVKESK